MTEKAIRELRRMRYMMTEICRYIFKQEWEMVCKYWKNFDEEFAKYVSEAARCDEAIRQCRTCVLKGNDVRLYELLRYEIDSYMEEQLSKISEDDRKQLACNAKSENAHVLKTCYTDIFNWINKEIDMTRIGCFYEGTDNISLSVKEDDHTFRLFSITNPWRESSDFVNQYIKGEPNEICILGFGGGYVVRELVQRFPHAMMKVCLPNADLFKSVIEHIDVSDVLQYKNLELCIDSVCLDFFSTINRKRKENRNFEFYIDRQELRACIPNRTLRESLIRKYCRMREECGIAEEKKEPSGVQIHNYIKGLVVNNKR